ncbi:MAG: rod shape-determining protein MreC [Acidobacteriota bacterium]
MARFRLRPATALVLACVGLYVAAAAQVRSGRGTALSLAFDAVSTPPLALVAALSSLWDDVTSGRHDLKTTLGDVRDLRREVAELRQSNQLLAAELAAMRQGSRLLAGLPTLSENASVAQVVARDLFVTHTMVLDRGARHGVALDAPVLGETGVLGRVDRVYGASCRVQLLTHPAAAAAARPVGFDAEGLLEGGDQPRLTGLPPYTEVSAETAVVTTGSEGIYPPGLLLGVTGESHTEGLFTSVKVILAARPAEAIVVAILPAGRGQP